MGGTLGPDDTLTVGGRTIRAIACPIGIDAQDFIASAGSATARDVQQRMSESGIGRGLIVGVDRLDYSKGLAERFPGYARFLEDRQSVVSGKSVSVLLDTGGRRIIKKKNTTTTN